MINFMEMMGQVKDAQEKMQEVKKKLGWIQVTGESGAGLVKVKVNGNKKVLKIDIDRSILQPEEQEMVQDLMVAAVNVAMEKIDIQVQEKLQDQAKDMFGNLSL
jgi:DNA-binding YbaB/EbfC family protein